jgi:TfoX/Sxy family transcriptional regulator of competence genes
MAYDEDLANRTRKTLADQSNVTEKKMFGGLVFMVNGHMCCGVVKEELMVRVGPGQHEAALALPYTRPMDPARKSGRGFVYVSPDGLREEADLSAWVGRGLSYVTSLPPK